MAQSAEVAKLLQAIEQFEARKPQNMPEGVDQALTSFKEAVSTINPEDRGDSPGQAEARQAAGGGGTDGTGVDFRKAARHPDQPSPGQREARQAGGVSGEIEQAAASIAQKIKQQRTEQEQPEPAQQ